MSEAEPEARPAPRRSWSTGRLLAGLGLIGLGGVWLLDATDALQADWALLLPVALGLVGVALLVGGSRVGGLVPLGFVLTALIFFVHIARPSFNFGWSIGERKHAPESFAEVEGLYRQGIGPLEIDLSGVDFDEGTQISASLGIGEMVVTLPEDQPVSVQASAGIGGLNLLGEEHGGILARGDFLSRTFDRDEDLTLDLSVGIGAIEVRR